LPPLAPLVLTPPLLLLLGAVTVTCALPERVLSALRAKKKAKAINLTEGVDPTSPVRFREHGGSLWHRGKGPKRHPLDPSRRETAVPAGGDD